MVPFPCLVFFLSQLTISNGIVIQRALLAECVAGFVGGVSKQACTHPFETVATLYEVQRGPHPDPLPWSKLISNPKQLYAGFLVAAVMNAPYAILFHVTMYTVANRLDRKLPEPIIRVVAGSCGAAVACIVGVPVDTMKVRSML
jgi:hypothetical protein